MAIYSKTTKQMVVDLINQGNPQLPFPINATDFEFSLPEVITDPGNGHNTRIRVMAKPNTNYVGNLLVTYRRLNVGFIFRNMTLHVQNWIANTGANGTQLTNLRTLLPLYSEKYGFNFTPEEWTDVGLTGNHGIGGTTFSIAPLSTNLAYIGSVTGRWEIGERTLESLLPVDQVVGRRFPGGNVFDGSHKYWVGPDSHHIDFTAFKDWFESGYLSGQPNMVFGKWYGSGMQNVHQKFISDILPLCTPRPSAPFASYTGYVRYASDEQGNPLYSYLTKTGGLNGVSFIRIVLPHSSYPEANSEFYNRAVVANLPADCPWGTGRLFFHYNV